MILLRSTLTLWWCAQVISSFVIFAVLDLQVCWCHCKLPVFFSTSINMWWLMLCVWHSSSVTGFCRDAVYSLTTDYNNGALRCDCSPDGSVSFNCQEFGGQCRCRPNIIGRTCSHCRTGYYGFPDCRRTMIHCSTCSSSSSGGYCVFPDCRRMMIHCSTCSSRGGDGGGSDNFLPTCFTWHHNFMVSHSFSSFTAALCNCILLTVR